MNLAHKSTNLLFLLRIGSLARVQLSSSMCISVKRYPFFIYSGFSQSNNSAQSCGYAVPIYEFVTHRTQLLRMADMFESRDRASAITSPEINQNGLKSYWEHHNSRSVDGLPGLLTAFGSKVTPVNNFDKEVQRPKLQYSSSRKGSAQTWSSGVNLAIGFVLGALVATTLFYILSAAEKFDMLTTRA